MSPQTPAYQQPFADVLAALGTDPVRGLTDVEARTRLDKHGRNELASEARIPAWKKFLAQFHDVLVILLLIAAAISAALWIYERETAAPYEAIAIFAVVVLNALWGTFRNRAPRRPSQPCSRWLRRMLT